MSNTVANVRRSDSSRFYYPDGTPCYEIPKKKGDGMKKPNITDAKELGLLPSVTTIIKDVLNKPALNNWLVEQAVLAIITTPRRSLMEKDDEFVKRVLQVEHLQDEQAEKAAQLGTDIHKAIECSIKGFPYPPHLAPFVTPVMDNLLLLGKKVWSEKVVVGDGYAGRSDYLAEDSQWFTVADWKTTSGKIPEKSAYDEHKMQMAAYAKTVKKGKKGVRTCAFYISTSTPGIVVPHVEHEWERDYVAFNHLLQVWRYINGVV